MYKYYAIGMERNVPKGEKQILVEITSFLFHKTPMERKLSQHMKIEN